ncbi:MAG: SRPBCC family protein [Actinomycetota bacterium]
MEIENSFEVPAAQETVWAYLLDVEKVVVCMPGASLTETIDDTHWKGKLTMKLGPVSLNFAGKVELAERDDEAHRVVLKGSGMEQRGKGAASATVTSQLESLEGGGTRVRVVQDIKVSGQAAQFSRGMMQDVSAKLTKQFSDCLKTNISVEEAEAASAIPEAAEANPDAVEPRVPPQRVSAKPVSGLSLAFGALASALARFFKRLFGRRQN